VTKILFKRKRKTKDPCEKCFLNRGFCICSQIPTLALCTRILLVIHSKELKRTTNTGRLAIHALINSEMLVRGEQSAQLDMSSCLNNGYETVLLYPSVDAEELSDYVSKPRAKPLQLIIPDGNWRQAGKVATRQPELRNVTRVKISGINQSNYHLRKEHFPEGLSTLEAIARSLAIIEGPQVGEKLMALYQAKLHATLRARGNSLVTE
jgi:DTW domain-containing protein YfiP